MSLKIADDYINLDDADYFDDQVYGEFAYTHKQVAKYINQARIDTIKECAELAQVESINYWDGTPQQRANGVDIYDDNGSDVPSSLAIVDKQSILKLIDQVK